MKALIAVLVVTLCSCADAKFSAPGEPAVKPPKERKKTEDVEPEEIEDASEVERISCFEPAKALPTQITALAEKYNWTASGDQAGYRQVGAAPVVGKIVNERASIVASAYVYSGPGDSSHWYEGSLVYAIDGVDGKQQWISSVLSLTGASAAIGDLDLDGKNEVVVIGNEIANKSAGDAYVYALNGKDGSVKWRSAKTVKVEVRESIGPSLADLDGNGSVEVIVGGSVLEGVSGRPLFNTLSYASDSESIVGDVNSNPGLEIISGEGIFSGKDGSRLCGFGNKLSSLAFAKLRKTDSYVTVVGLYDDTTNQITALRGSDCTKIFATKIQDDGGGSVNIADFDGDGELEMGTSAKSGYYAFETDGALLWKTPIQDISSGVTGSSTFDLNGDGQSEVIYGDETTLRIFNGKTGAVIYATPNSSTTWLEFPVIADVDGDGHANIIVGANTSLGGTHSGVRVFSAPKNDWISTRGEWNQHGYYVLNVGPNGEIAGFDTDKIWQGWLSSPHLLGFRNNLPLKTVAKCKKK